MAARTHIMVKDVAFGPPNHLLASNVPASSAGKGTAGRRDSELSKQAVCSAWPSGPGSARVLQRGDGACSARGTRTELSVEAARHDRIPGAPELAALTV